jgi:type IV pilus assembly protein PilC
MQTFKFEAMDATGTEIRDEITADNEEQAQATIREMGYFVTKISVKKGRKDSAAKKGGKTRSLAIGGVKTKHLAAFTRQLSILQNAGLPILRSLRILENQNKSGRLKNSLMDVCEEIESGSTLSEAMSKSPKAFDRLFVNMIKAGEAGGALEIILQRLADFMERSEALKRKVKGAMIYPIIVVMVAVTILTFIMIKIVPTFQAIFADFGTSLPPATQLLIAVSDATVQFWWAIPVFPTVLWLFVKLIRKFKPGRMGWDMFSLNWPVFGMLIEKNTMARTTRTLGTLVASGVPILESLTITRETCGNAMFERLFGKVTESIREGETIAQPMKDHSAPGFHPVALLLWALAISFPGLCLLVASAIGLIKGGNMVAIGGSVSGACAVLGGLYYITRMNRRVVNDLVVNMIDVGEETGELDTMLYKVADTFDDEVTVITDSLMSLLEPLLIVFLGGAVAFIVISLFMPLVSLIETLS